MLVSPQEAAQELLDRRAARTECEESLYAFFQRAWRNIDAAQLVPGWPIEAVTEHLQAVVDGEIRRLMIHIPPRCLKSSLCSVALPAWTWAQSNEGPTSGPGVRFLHASYAEKLSLRDSVKCRRLIESRWYQRLWGQRFALNSDQNTKHRFGNDRGGERLITSIGGTATGEGGDIIVIDDPNAANEAFSEATTQATIDWWDQTMSTRLNDPKTGAFIVIQQRLAENDLSGHILEQSDGEWCHLMLPMRYEADRSFVTGIGWKDPRTDEGQLLWPERFGEAEVSSLEKALGPWIACGQLQQRPEPAGGGIIKRDWWKLWEDAAFPPMDFIGAYLDTAFTVKTENDYSALTVWGVYTLDNKALPARMLDASGRPVDSGRRFSDQAPRVMLMFAWKERLPIHELVLKVGSTCKQLKIDRLWVENKAAGISVAQELRRLFADEDWAVELHDPRSTDKFSRLVSVAHLFAEGMVYAPDKAWAQMVLDEVAQFPRGRHDDLTDTVSGALRKMREMGLLVRAPERQAELQEALRYERAPEPLYPA